MRYIIFLICLSLCLTGCATDRKIAPATNALLGESNLSKAQIDSIYYCAKNFPDGTQMAISLVSDSTVKFIGTVRIDDTIKKEENYRKAFEIGSITKVFNSSILSKLILEGKINPDMKISDLLSIKLKGDPDITIKELANHTSGIERNPSNIKSTCPEKSYPENQYSDTEMLEYFSKHLRMVNEPGKKFSYSNIGSQLLGYYLCKIENKDFESLLQENIFLKYGMKNTTTDKHKLSIPIIQGLDKDGNPCTYWPWKSYQYAGNATLSTAEDMSRFAIALFDTNNTELHYAQLKTFHIQDSIFQNSTADIGLDWVILNRKSGEHWIWHNGATDGFYSHIIADVQKKRAVVFLSNISSTNKMRRTTQNLIESLLESIEKVDDHGGNKKPK